MLVRDAFIRTLVGVVVFVTCETTLRQSFPLTSLVVIATTGVTFKLFIVIPLVFSFVGLTVFKVPLCVPESELLVLQFAFLLLS